MKRTFTCEICGFTSGDEVAVRLCENQKSQAEYSVGQQVVFLYDPNGRRLEIQGEITNIHFTERTHDVRYTIFVEEDNRLGRRSNRSTHTEIQDVQILRVV